MHFRFKMTRGVTLAVIGVFLQLDLIRRMIPMHPRPAVAASGAPVPQQKASNVESIVTPVEGPLSPAPVASLDVKDVPPTEPPSAGTCSSLKLLHMMWSAFVHCVFVPEANV